MRLRRRIRRSAVPVFVISYNRGAMLRRTLDSYIQLSGDIELVVHDNGSDDEETLEVLNELSRDQITVRTGPKVEDPEQLNLVADTVQEYFRGAAGVPYVVTDCDIDMSVARLDAVLVYRELLDRFSEVECVGPMLRIRDIPPSYPLYNRVLNRHIEQFWHREPQWVSTSVGRIAYQLAPIDTTFALHRPHSRFHRLASGLRVYQPYEARHLDWYPTGAGGPYRYSSSASISHWNNAAQEQQFANEALAFRDFTYVDEDERGALVTRRMELY